MNLGQKTVFNTDQFKTTHYVIFDQKVWMTPELMTSQSTCFDDTIAITDDITTYNHPNSNFGGHARARSITTTDREDQLCTKEFPSYKKQLCTRGLNTRVPIRCHKVKFTTIITTVPAEWIQQNSALITVQ